MQILGAVCIIGGAMIGELIKTKKRIYFSINTQSLFTV